MRATGSLDIKITFLGTGTSTGVPMVGCDCEVCLSEDARDCRLRSSIFIDSPTDKVLVDAGPDLRQQLLTHHITDVDHILVTHHHKDHIGGLDDIRAITLLRQKAVQLFAQPVVHEAIRRELPYAFEEPRYPAAPRLRLIQVSKNEKILAGALAFTPIEVWHGNIKILGYRLYDFTYITDCSYIEEEEKEKIVGSKVLVINGIRWEKHSSHFSLPQAIQLAQELHIPQTYITHISHQLGRHASVSSQLPKGVALAYDGLSLDL